MRALVLTLVLAVALALGFSLTHDTRLSKQQYVRHANALCTRYHHQVARIAAGKDATSGQTSLPRLGRFLGRVQAPLSKLIDDFSALRAPWTLAPESDKLTADLRQLKTLLARLERAAKADRPEASGTALAAVYTEREQTHSLFQLLGLHACLGAQDGRSAVRPTPAANGQ